MTHRRIAMGKLAEIVSLGGSFRTGLDVFSANGKLLLKKDSVVNTSEIASGIKRAGIENIPINVNTGGGIWDKDGKPISFKKILEAPMPGAELQVPQGLSDGPLSRIREISRLQKAAVVKFENAKQNVKKVLATIKSTGGEFDYGLVENTVNDLLDFMSLEESAFSHLSREIFSYDDYLYNHSVNVCTFGTPVVKRLQEQMQFKASERLEDIAMGFFMHDVGKVLVPDEVLNKKGRLTPEEFDIVKKHSYELGPAILAKNQVTNKIVADMVHFHHAPLFTDEERCYPAIEDPENLSPYVRVCKLADIYDALTSKRCYKDAINPSEVVAELFHKYAKKSKSLKLVLHAFVSTIGIYPPGSVVYLSNHQLAYVLDSKGPLVLPFTDTQGKVSKKAYDPIDLAQANAGETDAQLKIDLKKPMKSPVEVYNEMPEFLKQQIFTTK